MVRLRALPIAGAAAISGFQFQNGAIESTFGHY